MNYSNSAAAADSIDINYFATGNGTTTPLKSDTVLTNEIFRKSITSKGVNTTRIEVRTQLGINDSNFGIKEVGIFANATGATDDGVLISHVLYDKVKNNSSQLTITYTITIL